MAGIVAIATSAGGFKVLRFLAKGFETEFPGSILVTSGLPLEFSSKLDQPLSAADLPTTLATEDEVRKNGRIYIAPPGRHLLVDEERLWLGAA